MEVKVGSTRYRDFEQSYRAWPRDLRQFAWEGTSRTRGRKLLGGHHSFSSFKRSLINNRTRPRNLRPLEPTGCPTMDVWPDPPAAALRWMVTASATWPGLSFSWRTTACRATWPRGPRSSWPRTASGRLCGWNAPRDDVVPHGLDNDVLLNLVNAYTAAGMPGDGVVRLTAYALLQYSSLTDGDFMTSPWPRACSAFKARPTRSPTAGPATSSSSAAPCSQTGRGQAWIVWLEEGPAWWAGLGLPFSLGAAGRRNRLRGDPDPGFDRVLKP